MKSSNRIDPPSTGPDPNDRTGMVMALAAAAGLGLAVAAARLAYTGGTNGLTLSATRGSLMTALLLILCLATRRRLRLQPAVWLHCVGLGLLLAMMFYGNIASVQFIPVGLAALLFYTYPPMVAIIDAVLLRHAPDPVKLTAMLVAFTGLAVMLGASVAAVEPRGGQSCSRDNKYRLVPKSGVTPKCTISC